LLDPAKIDDLVESLPDLGLARQAHACTHMTIAPTIIRGGTKINVIPDTVDLEIDIRTLPGQGEAEVMAILQEAVGDLWPKVEVLKMVDDPSTASPVDTPLWETMQKGAARFHPDAPLLPFFTVGATDARFFRRLGSICYGYGMFSERLSFEQFAVMFHGDDERVDVESLQMSTDMFEQLARDFLG
jgi:acetylornithine deacetylase/succinyl-diaminopimelate desuccinylase-like protein